MLIKNLGPVKELEIYLNQETILLGKNNSGKTFVSYLIYGVFKRFETIKKEIINNYVNKKLRRQSESFILKINREELNKYIHENSLKSLNGTIKKDLSKIFNLPEENFVDTHIRVEDRDLRFLFEAVEEKDLDVKVRRFNVSPRMTGTLMVRTEDENFVFELKNIESKNLFSYEEEEIVEISEDDINSFFIKILSEYISKNIYAIPNIMYIPAERNGINVFRKELYKKRSFDSFNLEQEKEVYTYPLPISDYMQYLNDFDYEQDETIMKFLNRMDPVRTEIWNDFSENILKGKYEYENNSNEYYYRELYSVTKNGKLNFRKQRIPLKVASSSTKSLFGLEYYLKNKITQGDILFIDEPEMNLDPENQIKMAELLINLASMGVKVIISTHSDYLTRATTNALLKSRIENKNPLDNSVSGYYFEKSKILPMGNLTEVTYINNFDDPNIQLEETYMEYRNIIDSSK